MMWFMIMLAAALAAPAPAPDVASERDALFVQFVADSFDRDCRQPAPTPRLARDLDFLCKCTVARIRASDIRYGEDDITHARIQAAQEACSREYYGQDPHHFAPPRPSSGE